MAPQSRRPVVAAVRDADQLQLLRTAQDLASDLGTPLRVVHLYWTPESPADLYGGHLDQSMARASARRVVDRVRQDLTHSDVVNVRYASRFSTVAAGLQAESEAAAVLVIGCGHLDRRLVRSAGCPLVVVPNTEFSSDGEVVAAVDVDNLLPDVIGFAAELSSRPNTQLRVVSIVPGGLASIGREQQHARLDRGVNRWRRPGQDISTQVISADLMRTLIGVTENARMLVVGRPNQPYRGLRAGRSVISRLLRDARCPVAIVPAGTESGGS